MPVLPPDLYFQIIPRPEGYTETSNEPEKPTDPPEEEEPRPKAVGRWERLRASLVDGRRTPESIAEKYKDRRSFNPTMPMGPWKETKDAHAELNEWAENWSVGGGAFSIVRMSLRAGNTVRARQQVLECVKAGKSIVVDESRRKRKRAHFKCECPWNLCIEESSEGWVPAYTGKDGVGTAHNHPLDTEEDVRRNDRRGVRRRKPDEKKKDLMKEFEELAELVSVREDLTRQVSAMIQTTLEKMRRRKIGVDEGSKKVHPGESTSQQSRHVSGGDKVEDNVET